MASASNSNSKERHEIRNENAYRDESSSPQLVLVPLHPACRKQTLEMKELPIVLGRTNLANWWWKSCPCQHYCRLHCRPVAQNIKSLSKVMIQIDTAGRVHVVGKNPHLVTITPERDDNILHTNDILSIGRRDREPWMRLQVVRKSDNDTSLPRSTSNSHRRTSSPPNNPPEWITTHCRKRLFSPSRYEDTEQHQQRRVTNELVEAAYAAASDSLQQTCSRGAKNNMDSDSNLPRRKRRRTKDNIEKNTTRGKERSSRNDFESRNGKHRSALSAAASQMDKDHHPQVHLVLQDYETSAMLVRATQRKQRKRSSDKGIFKLRAPFIVEKNQLRLLKNSSAVLVGSTSSATGHDRKSPQDVTSSHSRGIGLHQESKKAYTKAEAIHPEYYTRPSGSSRDPIDWQLESLAESKQKVAVKDKNSASASPIANTGESTTPTDKTSRQTRENPILLLSHCTKPSSEIVNAASSLNPSSHHENKYGTHQEASMLSLPLCASSSFDLEEDQQVDKKRDSKRGSPTPSDESECSPTTRDPMKDLGPWREIVNREEGGTFRHAVASLIVAKNENQERSENESLWLPSLLESDFRIETRQNS